MFFCIGSKDCFCPLVQISQQNVHLSQILEFNGRFVWSILCPSSVQKPPVTTGVLKSAVCLLATDGNVNEDVIITRPFGNGRMTCREIRRNSAGCIKFRDECEKCKEIQHLGEETRSIINNQSQIQKSWTELFTYLNKVFTLEHENSDFS